MNYVSNITDEQLLEVMKRLPPASRLIWQLGYETGLRISDILSLRVISVTSNPIQAYESRTQRIRMCGLTDRLFYALSEHIKGKDLAEYLFSGKQADKPLHRSTFHRQIKNTGCYCSAHSTRRWFLAPK